VELAGGLRSRNEELDVVVGVGDERGAFSVEHWWDPLLPLRETLTDAYPILQAVETPEYLDAPEPGAPTPTGYLRPAAGGIWAAGERVTWISGLVLALSAFMGWYSGSGEGVTLTVSGWHTGLLGKIVFFVGLAVLAIVALRESGLELPRSVPESLVIVALGAIATVLVAVRVVDVPESVLPADGRWFGVWISLVAALGVIVGGVLRVAEEL